MDREIRPMSMNGNLAENWKLWIQKFNNYLIASESSTKPDTVKCAKLIHYLGEDAFPIHNTFTFTDAEKDNFDALVKKFNDYFTPKKSTAFERYKFFPMRQKHESIEQFATDLINQAQKCEFAQLQDSLVKDMLTIGVKNQQLKEKLLQNDELELRKAIELCIVAESTKSQTQQMQETTESSGSPRRDVDAVQHNQQRQRAATPQGASGRQQPSRNDQTSRANTRNQQMINNCTRCGKTHEIRKCLAYGKTCNKCKRPNHFSS